MLLNNPALSVILPVYNAGDFISEAIQSILRQTFTSFELLVVDDASTDHSWNVINSFNNIDRVRVFRNKFNLGKNESINQVLGYCRGEFLTIHDADDYSDKNRFELQVQFLKSNPEYSMVGTSFYEVYNSGFIKAVSMPTNYDEIKQHLPLKSQFHGPTLVFRKDILQDVGGLFRYFTWGEDIDFTTRVVEKFKATNLTDHLYFYRMHSASLTKSLHVLKPERFINPQLRLILANQRVMTGTDCLMENNVEALEKEKSKLLLPYKRDPSLVYWMFSQQMLSQGFYRVARQAALKALARRQSFRNLKNLVYTICQSAKSPRQ